MLPLAVLALSGAVAGALGAMLGVGGGFVIVPALSILFGVPMHTAVAAGQVGVVATSTVASLHYLREGLVHLRLALALLLATTLGAATGAAVGSKLDARYLSVVFGVVLLYVAWRMMGQRSRFDDGEITVHNCPVSRWWLGHTGAYVGGALSGLLGIGGGVINVPLFCLGMRIPMRLATATSAFLVGITGATAAIVYYSRGHTDLVVTGATVLGALAGAALGARVATRINAGYLRIAFGALAAYTAIVMIGRGLELSL
ncbi:MAG: sulfite exporter TauE/SafE family protein [Anaerolineae bacterium]|nr:sulfite exporter TauE/SafE family protein [Anaerolineae bacterium]